MAPPDNGPLLLHASAIAVGRFGLLVIGASGSGKSTLAIQLVSLGAQLVADDRVMVHRMPEGGLRLSAPETTRGIIEARGLGLLRVLPVTAMARAVVDLDRVEEKRLPEARTIEIAGVELPLLRKVESPAFAPMLFLYLQGGRLDP